jgi:hypothetical protein
MGSGYVVIAGVLLYLLLIREADAWGIRPKKAAAILILGYYLLLIIVRVIGYSLQEVSVLSNLLSPLLFFTAIVQYGVALFIFKKVEESGDEYLSYTLWGGAGLALLFFIVPRILQSVAAAL